MSNPDIVPPTDPERIKAHLSSLTQDIKNLKNDIRSDFIDADETLQAFNTRLNTIVDGINSVGSQVQWLVENTQQLFKFMNSPQLMGMVMGRMTDNLPGMMEGMADGGPGTAESPGERASTGEHS